jgi:hypothetical protein
MSGGEKNERPTGVYLNKQVIIKEFYHIKLSKVNIKAQYTQLVSSVYNKR